MKSIFQSSARSRRHRQAQAPESQQEQQQPFFASADQKAAQTKPQPFFQAKLAIGKPGDPYEREADAVADAVVNQQHSGKVSAGGGTVQRMPITPLTSSNLQRLATPDEEKMPATNDGRMAEDKQIQEKPLQKAEEEEEPVQAMEAPKEEEKTVQKAEEEEEPVQAMEAPKEEEKPVQKAEEEEEPVQAMEAPKEEEKPVQKAEEEEEPMQAKEKEEEPIQTKSQPGVQPASANLSHHLSQRRGSGNPLPKSVKSNMEQSFGTDFSAVRVHTDSSAVDMNRDLHAQAFTHGQDIYFNSGKFNPEQTEGKHLLAHELTHVVQQGGGNLVPQVQRRLFVSGANQADPREYLDLVGNAGGLRLGWSFTQPRVQILGNTATPPTSQSGRGILQQIINHSKKHAEIFVGTHQPGVSIGAFPVGAGNTIQDVDIDDIRNLNAALPGQGTAKAFHEMFENFTAHTLAGMGPFGTAHAAAVEAESNVLEDQGIVGRRLNAASSSTPIPNFLAAIMGLPTGPNISYSLDRQVFTHYFLDKIERMTITPAGADFEIVRAIRTPKAQISQLTIDNFNSGTVAVPPSGAANLTATLATLTANPNSTLLIEGFSDSKGSSKSNLIVSRQRAESARTFFIASGISSDRIAIVGRGETNFVATNSTRAGRALNRRVVLTVHN